MIQYVDLVSDTICAPITAQGYASVAVIRVSGDKAWSITKRFIDSKRRKPRSHQVFLTSFKNRMGKNLDQVLITYFEKGRSFSGDETVEIACHGNPLLVNAIHEVYLNNGCRMAEPGEFSFRAFYNGRIDLVQAESIQKIVKNDNLIASGLSLGHLTGELSLVFKNLEERIITVISHLEARIDFVEQDVEPDEDSELVKLVNGALRTTDQLLSSYELGKNIGRGHKILICGPTNVGKSSLFNRFFNEERAIVTSREGTTRDLVTGRSFLGSHCVEFVDSAGIRETRNPAERMGVKKAFKAIEDSCLILCVIDKLDDLGKDFFKKLPLDRCFLVFNKIDLLPFRETAFSTRVLRGSPLAGIEDPSAGICGERGLKGLLDQIISMNTGFKEEKIFFVSALRNLHLENLKENIINFMNFQNSSPGEGLITQTRHFSHLLKLQGNLRKALEFLKRGESPDLTSQEMGMGLCEIHRILGRECSDEVLDKIFSEFCIGK